MKPDIRSFPTDSRMRGRIFVIGLTAAFPALHLFIQHSGFFGSGVRLVMPYVLWVVVSMLAGWRSILSAHHTEKRSAYIAWRLMGAAAFLWCAGIILELVSLRWVDSYEVIIGLRRLLYLAYPIMLVIGVFTLASFRSRTLGLFNLANIGVISSAMVVCVIIILLQPLIQSDESLAYLLFSIADLATLFTATIVTLYLLWAEDRPTSRVVIILLALSTSTHAAANIGFYLDAFRLGNYSGSLDIAWLVALMLHYWAAHEQEIVPQVAKDEAPRAGWAGLYSRVALVILPAALVTGIVVIALFFAANLDSTVIKMALFPTMVFAFFLGLREWALNSHRESLVDELLVANTLNSHVLRTSPGVVVMCEARDDFRPTYVSENGQLLFGIDATNFDFKTHVHPDERSLVLNCLYKALREGDAGCEFRLLGKQGEWYWIDLRIVLKRETNDKPAELIGTMLDITERKNLQLSVEQTQRLESLGRLSGSIAHDFNNLLTVISGFSEILLADPTLENACRQHITEIKGAANKGAALTQQLLTFSRRHTVSTEVIDVNEIVMDMGEMLERLLAEGVTLEVRISDKPLSVEGNKTQIEQVVLNLVVNASDAMPNGGRILLETGEAELETAKSGEVKATGMFARISVSDEGPGIDEIIRTQIFEPFFTTKVEGTGLGLATVHGIVRQHDGHIDVGGSPSGGTRFDVLLPTTRSAKSIDAVAPPPTKLGNECILVVDDEVAITRVIATALSPMGYTVFTASSAEEAVAIARDQSFDLIVSDVIMPVCNGYELVHRLRKVQSDFQVIFMSGYTDRALKQQHLQEEKALFLEKPIDIGQLTTAIRRQLDAEGTERNSDGY